MESGLTLRGSPWPPTVQLALVLLFGYAAYSTAEAVGGSGILAMFTTGVLVGHYHVQHLSAPARDSAGVALKALAHLAETAVFAYMGAPCALHIAPSPARSPSALLLSLSLSRPSRPILLLFRARIGIDLFAITGAGVDAFVVATAHMRNQTIGGESLPGGSGPSEATLDGDYNAQVADAADAAQEHALIVRFVFYALAVVVLARFVVMLPLCFLANCFRDKPLSRRAMGMLVFAGLRGAIAFALAHNVHSAHQPSIAAATTTVVLATVFVLGGATRTMLRVLQMEAPATTRGGANDRQVLRAGGERSDDPDGAAGTQDAQLSSALEVEIPSSTIARWFVRFEERFVQVCAPSESLCVRANALWLARARCGCVRVVGRWVGWQV